MENQNHSWDVDCRGMARWASDVSSKSLKKTELPSGTVGSNHFRARSTTSFAQFWYFGISRLCALNLSFQIVVCHRAKKHRLPSCLACRCFSLSKAAQQQSEFHKMGFGSRFRLA